jgi:hypothetical protein
MYVVVDTMRSSLVLGAVVVEPLTTAFINTCMVESKDVKCGIALVWVNQSEQRRGIASILLNAVVEK